MCTSWPRGQALCTRALVFLIGRVLVQVPVLTLVLVMCVVGIWYTVLDTVGSMHGFSTFFNLVQRSLVFGFIVRGWKILKYHVLTPWYQVLYIKYPVPCQYMYLSIQFVVKSERAGAWVKSLGQGYLSTWYGYLYLRLVYKAQNLCETEWMSVLASYK